MLHEILYFLYYYSTMNKTIWSVRPLGHNIISFLPLYYVFVCEADLEVLINVVCLFVCSFVATLKTKEW